MSEPSILWRPDSADIETANITLFQKAVTEKLGRSFSNYSELHRWSIDQPAEFWAALWNHLEIKASRGWTSAVTPAERMRETRFFEGSRLNFAENLLRHRDQRVVVIFRDEAGNRFEVTGAELWREVARTAAGLRNAGIVAGDRVAGFVPNHPCALIAMLATTSIGAIWSSCSPDFGTSGVLDRFGQIQPKVLFTADGYHYKGKTFDSLSRVSKFAAKIPSIQSIVVFPYLKRDPNIAGIPGAVLMSDFQVEVDSPEFVQLPFDHPAFILYTSGTTGVPKCIVHTAGGALIQLMKDHQLHCDLHPGDRLFFYSTCGWMMWNWLVTGLASGCTIILFDGSPFAPDPNVLWKLADEEQVTAFGIGARYLASIEKEGLEPGGHFDLSQLRLLMSTGSVLPAEGYDYVYSKIKSDLLLASVTGGTDILSAFALGVRTKPLYRGEIQCVALGMAVDILDDEGAPVMGESGELVCTKPFPSMPLKFWSDTNNERYDDAYFARFPGVWCHGDFAELTERGGLVIHGRSDAVLNPGGVRIGTAEIYRQVDKLDEILESVCIGQIWNNDIRIVLFVILRGGFELTDELKQRIRQVIRENATPRHVPARIVAVPDAPKTLSGKIAEIAVRDVVHGRVVKNTDALANPEALGYFENIAELSR